MTWLVRNWHLKLGALALATVLYTGFVYSGSFSELTFPGVPVQAINQPSQAYPLTQNLGTVDVRYRLAADVASRVTVESFAVTVDLSEYDMDRAPQPQALPISVQSLSDGVEVLDYNPKTVAVELDRLGEKEVPVVVDRGTVPEGLAIGTPDVSEESVIAVGPESQLGRVERAVARVQIFETAIDIQRQVDLVPVDVDGAEVDSVELIPATVTVEIDVRAVETSKSVPVRPQTTGAVANGFEITTITVEPAIVTVFGMPEDLAAVEEVSTRPLSIDGIAATTSREARLTLPEGTRLSADVDEVVVTIEVEPVIATRTLLVGVVCRNAGGNLACLPQQDQVAVLVSGPASALADLAAADLSVVVDAGGLDAGEHQLTPNVSLPDGVELESVSPGSVTVLLQAPVTPSPAPG
ncbi:MAG TPA: CdaR family protein [Candidatus Limnocylindria bacterium]|jgi:YbbR domain-containing protein